MGLRGPRAVGAALVLLAAAGAGAPAGCALIAGLSDHSPFPPGSVAQLSAGKDHACALTHGGKVWCWGSNASGQLGTGDTTTPPEPSKVKSLGRAADVAAALSGSSTCAALEDGSIWCWGQNADGVAGSLGISAFTTPSQVPGIQGAVSVRTGDGGGCAAESSGAFLCWGNDGDGTLGTSPTVAANDASGAVWCWGIAAAGALGPATPTACAAGPCPAAQRVLAEVAAVAVGSHFAVVLREDGTVWSWGQDDQGQLGRTPAPTTETACTTRYGVACSAEPAAVQAFHE
jgi:alpha-tubulin suppressor-like RCC1 family protein